MLAISPSFGSPVNADIVYGDLNGDGKINVSDAIIVLRSIVDLSDLNAAQKIAADVNEDGDINVQDAIIILRYIVDIVDGLPYTPGACIEVHFIDVGQGDSILIITPNNRTILIDGGERKETQTVLSYLEDQGIDRIDIAIATHPHSDHIGGLIGVIDKIPVSQIIDSGFPHTTKTYEDYLTGIDQKNIPFTVGRSGDTIDLDPSVSIEILHPGKNKNIEDYTANNASIITKIIYDQIGFLLTGDAEQEAESETVNRNYDFSKIKILKTGHHGSGTSTSDLFLNAVKPSMAVIMCGTGNSYGHPHTETLSALQGRNIDIYRTDLHGDIIVKSDGQTYEVNTEPCSDTPDPEHKGLYIGSTKSDKYHYPTCVHAKNILPENEIWFDSEIEAIEAGYTPCGSCKPPQPSPVIIFLNHISKVKLFGNKAA